MVGGQGERQRADGRRGRAQGETETYVNVTAGIKPQEAIGGSHLSGGKTAEKNKEERGGRGHRKGKTTSQKATLESREDEVETKSGGKKFTFRNWTDAKAGRGRKSATETGSGKLKASVRAREEGWKRKPKMAKKG